MDTSPGDILEEFSIAAQDLLAASYDTFGDSSRRLGDAITKPASLAQVVDETLPEVDFESWYAAQRATQGSFVGSGRLDWPRDSKERLAMQVALFRALGNGQVNVLEFCRTFLWAGTRHDDNVRNFLDQIARPFLRDLERHVRRLDQLRPMPPIVALAAPGDTHRKAQVMADPRKVFVVYGRDESLRKSIFDFLRSIGLIPMEWGQAVALTGQGSPYIGDVIAVAFEVAQAIVVILSPDDEVRLSPALCAPGEDTSETSISLQPRPNVLFEAGMAFGSKPDRTILVEVGAVKRFSDVAGRHAIRLNNTEQRRHELLARLETAGCATDVMGTDWLSAGNFIISRSGAGPAPRASTEPTSDEPSVRYVDLDYPADSGIVAEFAALGQKVQWCSDDRLARALDIERWELVRHREAGGREFMLKMHDKPFDQTLVSRKTQPA